MSPNAHDRTQAHFDAGAFRPTLERTGSLAAALTDSLAADTPEQQERALQQMLSHTDLLPDFRASSEDAAALGPELALDASMSHAMNRVGIRDQQMSALRKGEPTPSALEIVQKKDALRLRSLHRARSEGAVEEAAEIETERRDLWRMAHYLVELTEARAADWSHEEEALALRLSRMAEAASSVPEVDLARTGEISIAEWIHEIAPTLTPEVQQILEEATRTPKKRSR